MFIYLFIFIYLYIYIYIPLYPRVWWLVSDGMPRQSLSPVPDWWSVHPLSVQGVETLSRLLGVTWSSSMWWLVMAPPNVTILLEVGYFVGLLAHLWATAHVSLLVDFVWLDSPVIGWLNLNKRFQIGGPNKGFEIWFIAMFFCYLDRWPTLKIQMHQAMAYPRFYPEGSDTTSMFRVPTCLTPKGSVQRFVSWFVSNESSLCWSHSLSVQVLFHCVQVLCLQPGNCTQSCFGFCIFTVWKGKQRCTM